MSQSSRIWLKDSRVPTTRYLTCRRETRLCTYAGVPPKKVQGRSSSEVERSHRVGMPEMDQQRRRWWQRRLFVILLLQSRGLSNRGVKLCQHLKSQPSALQVLSVYHLKMFTKPECWLSRPGSGCMNIATEYQSNVHMQGYTAKDPHSFHSVHADAC